MKFTFHSDNIFESDAGFSIKVIQVSSWPPLTHFIHKENGRILTIEGHRIAGARGVLYPNLNAKWDPPHDQEPVELLQYAKILLNIKAAFDFQKQPFDFQKPVTKADQELYRLLEPGKTYRFFSIPKSTICECSEGYSIEFNGRSLSPLLYRMGGKSLRMDYYYDTDSVTQGMLIRGRGKEYRWEPPHHHEPLTASEIALLMTHIELAVRYMKSEGYWPPPALDLSPTFLMPKPNVCECKAAGFSIELVLGSPPAATVLYRDGDKLFRVGVDIIPDGLEHYKWSKVWDYPFNNILLTRQEQARIVCNIIAAIKYMRSAGAWPPRRYGPPPLDSSRSNT